MILNFRNILTLVLIGFVVGFSSTFLLSERSNMSSNNRATNNVKELRKNADSAENNYLAQIKSLEDQNVELQHELEVSQSLLEQAKEASTKTENQIRKITRQQTLPRGSVKEEIDDCNALAIGQSSCDSLASEIVEYIDETHQKDSLYENQIQTLGDVVSVKDSVIKADEKLYSGLHQLFDQSLEDQKALQNENLQLEKQFKRWRVRGKVEKIGIALLTATATYLLSHH